MRHTKDSATLVATTVEADAAPKIHLPSGEAGKWDQDEEWCEVHLDGEVQRVRFHDYAAIYSVPGLYERIFYEELECDSPRTVCGLLEDVLRREEVPPEQLSVLDVGAGNGMVGGELADLGAETIVGVDIIEEAAAAAERDRPGVYDDYKVIDLTGLQPAQQRELEAHEFNCLTTVAALGFGDIPPEAFAAAYDLVEDDGWVAFNIKEDFIDNSDPSGFAKLIQGGLEAESLELMDEHRYQHRLGVDGEPIHYVAMIARKRGELLAA